MLVAVMSAFACTPTGRWGVASDQSVALDGTFIVQGQGLGEIELYDAEGLEVPVEVVYDEQYDSSADVSSGSRVAVRPVDGWVAGASYIANLQTFVWPKYEAWSDLPFVVSTELALPVTGTPSITLDEVIDHSGEISDSCHGFSHEYTVTVTPASADPSGWSTLLVEHHTGHQDLFDLSDGPATVTTRADGLDECLRVTQIDATGARSESEWTCGDGVDEPFGCASTPIRGTGVGLALFLTFAARRRARAAG